MTALTLPSWVGLQGIQPDDAGPTNDALTALQPKTVRLYLNPHADAAWNERRVACNSNYNIILCLASGGDKPLISAKDQAVWLSGFMANHGYLKIIGINPLNETDSVAQYIEYAKAIKSVTRVPIYGPSNVNSMEAPAWVIELREAKMLPDVFATHGWGWMPGGGQPNILTGEHETIADAVNVLRLLAKVRPVCVSECPINSQDVAAAAELGARLALIPNLTCVLHNINGPIGVNAWGNMNPDYTFSKAVEAFIGGAMIRA